MTLPEMRKKNIALIPARAGSKGLPGKNTRLLQGKPLVAWTIEAALACEQIDLVYVSTDCPIVADIATTLGAILPDNSLRPAHLAEDTTPGIAVVRHVLEAIDSPCRLILLQPTSPLRATRHIDEAISLFEKQNNLMLSVVSMTEAKPLSWQGQINAEGFWERIESAETVQNRQQVSSTYYQLNGAIYIAESSKLLESDFLTGIVLPYVMSPETSVDIDTLADFCAAEALLRLQESAEVKA